MGKMIHQLPVEMVEEMLYKLPVKSLLRFKCVSKSWRRFISSRGFIREHLNQSINTTTGTHHFAHHNIVFKLDQWYTCAFCSIASLLNEDDDDDECGSNLLIPTRFAREDYRVFMVSSCNGLILITNYKDLYLCNPSTRKSKNILSRDSSFPPRTSSVDMYGLGYNESTDDYKVLMHQKRSMRRYMYMYSSRTDSWKEIQDYKGGFPFYNNAKFVNGRLYWLTQMEIRSLDIASLDLVEEKHQIMARPHFFSNYHDVHLPGLNDAGGYLSLIFTNNYLFSTDIWVMKEECCWSKIWAFSHIGRHVVPLPNFPNISLLWLSKNGDILVALESDLVIYYNGRKDKLLRYSRVDGLHNRSWPIVYVESLVDPFALGDDQ